MWQIDNKKLSSRLLLGTAQYPSPEILAQSIEAANTEVITVSIRRQQNDKQNNFWGILKKLNCHILPNTAGCYSAKDAITTAQMAREIFQTNWIKLEVIGDEYTLQPDPFELVKAAEQLNQLGFTVLPYMTDDLILAQKLVDVGCDILMPWAAPIGSGKGLINPYALRLLRERFQDKTIIVDAGIGKPSDATIAMEMGMDAVLLNSAVAGAQDPVTMARAFYHAVEAGRAGFESGLIPENDFAKASSPLKGVPFWHAS